MEENKETKIETKKLDDQKNTPENKKALAEADAKTMEGKKSKPAVEKVTSSKKSEIVELEREYVVPLRKNTLTAPSYKRAKKAIRVLKEFLVRHMNVRDGDLRKIKIDINLNNEIWFRGIKKPLHKVKVKAKKINGIVYVELAEVPEIVGYKIARMEKRKASSVKAKPTKQVEKEDSDKDNDGIDDKVEEKEDVKSEAIMDAKMNKEAAKAQKHTTVAAHKNEKPLIKQPKKN